MVPSTLLRSPFSVSLRSRLGPACLTVSPKAICSHIWAKAPEATPHTWPVWWWFRMPPVKCSFRMVKHSVWPAVLLVWPFNLHMFPYWTREFFFLFHQRQVCSHSVRTTKIGHGKLPPRSKVWKILFCIKTIKKPQYLYFTPPPTHTHTCPHALSSEDLLSLPVTTAQMVSVTVIVGNPFSGLCRFTSKKKFQSCKWVMTSRGLLCSLKSPPSLFLYLLLKFVHYVIFFPADFSI